MTRWFFLLSSLVLLGGCATSSGPSHTHDNNEPAQLVVLENLKDTTSKKSKRSKRDKDEVSLIRHEMLRDTALSLGAQSGYAYRTEQINAILFERSEYLSQIFNFSALLLDDNIQPPVLVEQLNALTQSSPYDIRVSDTNYRIARQAEFVTTPAVWSDYLLMQVNQPEPPDSSLLPKNEAESAIWQRNIQKGWEQGIHQGNSVYQANLNRLRRDFQGMARYRTLLTQNMVSAPEVAIRALGITGGGDEMSINDRVLTITALPALRADGRDWEAVIID